MGSLYEKKLNRLDAELSTSFKPYLISRLPASCNEDSVYSFLPTYSSPGKNLLKKAVYGLVHDHFITIDKDILHLTIDPLVDFEAGRDISWKKNTFVNTRGFNIAGDVGKKFSFSTSYYENEGLFPQYITQFIKDTLLLPGQAKVKGFNKNGKYDYAFAAAYISYTPSKYLNLQFGHDKNFIGDGYRSLLLSDNAVNYPFLKITANVWKLQYVNLWTQMLDVRDKALLGEGFRKKYGAFHYLSLLVGKRLEIGLFEAVIWQASDSGSYRGFDFNYLNPVIFYHAVQNYLGSPDNSLLGLNIKGKISNTLSAYGQFLLDDFDLAQTKLGKGFYRNKYGFQLGAKWFDAFGLKNLYVQTEYNQVWPYTYAHKLPVQNYAHYNQPLADPLGANFREEVTIVNYRLKRFSVNAELLYALIGTDLNSNYNEGQNIYRSDFEIPGSFDSRGKFVGTYNNYVTQGVKNTLIYAELKFDYLINPKNNLHIELTLAHRQLDNVLKKSETNFITFGIVTNLINKYYDF